MALLLLSERPLVPIGTPTTYGNLTLCFLIGLVVGSRVFLARSYVTFILGTSWSVIQLEPPKSVSM